MLLHRETTDVILKSFFKVYNALGYGFFEKVYENALKHELISAGYRTRSQQPISVFYQGPKVGLYFADLIIEDKVIIEIKAAENLCEEFSKSVVIRHIHVISGQLQQH